MIAKARRHTKQASIQRRKMTPEGTVVPPIPRGRTLTMVPAFGGGGHLGLVGATAEDRELVAQLAVITGDHELEKIIKGCLNPERGIVLVLRLDLEPLPPPLPAAPIPKCSVRYTASGDRVWLPDREE